MTALVLGGLIITAIGVFWLIDWFLAREDDQPIYGTAVLPTRHALRHVATTLPPAMQDPEDESPWDDDTRAYRRRIDQLGEQ